MKDRDRRSEIDKMIKEVEKSAETFQKEAKRVYDKKPETLNMDRASTPAQFTQQYDKFFTPGYPKIQRGHHNIFP